MLCNTLSFPDLWKFSIGNGLQAIQNKFIKAISFSDKYDSPYPLFHIHSILKISDIIKLQIASFVYESRMRLSPLEFHTYFTSISDVHSYGTRQSTSEDLFQRRRRTTQYGINTVHYFGATLWNSIDDDIKKISVSECLLQKIEAFLPGLLCMTNNLTLHTRMIGLIGRVYKRC